MTVQRLARNAETLPTPTLTLDIVPFAVFFCTLVSAICLVLMLRFRRGPRHFPIWAAGGVAISIGLFLIVLRGSVADALSILAGNLAVIGGYTAFAVGTRIERRNDPAPEWLAGAAFALLFSVSYFAGASLETRVIVISLAIAFFTFRMSFVFIARWRSGDRNIGVRLAAIALPGLTAVCVLRIGALLGLIPIGASAAVVHTGTLVLALLANAAAAIVIVCLSAPAWVRSAAIVPPTDGTVAPVAEATVQEADVSLAAESSSAWQLASARRALVTPAGAELRLTGSEYMVLQELATDRNAPVPREVLIAALGRDAANTKDRSVDILISRLRKKCADAGGSLPITSVRGRGYVFHGDLTLL